MEFDQQYQYAADEEFQSGRREMLRDDIARRLRRVCAHYSDDDFQELVESMVEKKLKGDRTRTL